MIGRSTQEFLSESQPWSVCERSLENPNPAKLTQALSGHGGTSATALNHRQGTDSAAAQP